MPIQNQTYAELGLTHDQVHAAFMEMDATGSHFTRALAELYFRADGNNTRKILETWPEYIFEFYERSLE